MAVIDIGPIGSHCEALCTVIHVKPHGFCPTDQSKLEFRMFFDFGMVWRLQAAEPFLVSYGYVTRPYVVYVNFVMSSIMFTSPGGWGGWGEMELAVVLAV